MKLKVIMVIEDNIDDVVSAVQTLSEEVTLRSISIEPLEEKEEK